jgi:PIN domain nuclease of toxin-antitoxin system
MRFLLDSNSLIWVATDPARLSRRAYQLIGSREHEIFVSFASLWEITIKVNRGKLPQVGSSIQYLLDEIREQEFVLLPLDARHLLILSTFEHHHRDPFDRMLAAQSACEGMPLLTNDTLIARYPVEIVW